VVQKGLSQAPCSDIFPDIHDEAHCFDAFFIELNCIVCTKILGSMQNPSQWECPCDWARCELGIICLDNNKTQKVVNGLDLIINFCIALGEQSKWKDCIADYRQAMLLLRKKTDLSNDEVKMFQQHVDAFFCGMGVATVTQRCDKLHPHAWCGTYWRVPSPSPQPIQALATGVGGFQCLVEDIFLSLYRLRWCGNCGTGIRSKLIPIAWWLSRCVLWLMGYDWQSHTGVKCTTKCIQQWQWSDSNNDSNDEENFSDDEIIEESDTDSTIWNNI